jgi:hypothetical protein
MVKITRERERERERDRERERERRERKGRKRKIDERKISSNKQYIEGRKEIRTIQLRAEGIYHLREREKKKKKERKK